MARGRMLNKKISLNNDVARLVAKVGPYGGLFYTWMLAHLDKEGRIHGDPEVLKGMVAPRIAGIDPEVIRKTSAAAFRLGLLQVYESGGDTYISFPRFKQNQVGLRADREPDSELPPPPEDIRQPSGNDPEECRPNRREGKGIEGKGTSCSEPKKDVGSKQAVIEMPIVPNGEFFPITQEMLDQWAQTYPGVDVLAEVRKAVQWCHDNPRKRKTKAGARRYLGSWIGRVQDKGGNGKLPTDWKQQEDAELQEFLERTASHDRF